MGDNTASVFTDMAPVRQDADVGGGGRVMSFISHSFTLCLSINTGEEQKELLAWTLCHV